MAGWRSSTSTSFQLTGLPAGTALPSPVWPPLTTIRQPMADLARTATQILIAGGDITHKRLPHNLVERASVAPPKRNL